MCIYLYDFCRNFVSLLKRHKPLTGLAFKIPSWYKHLLTVLLCFVFVCFFIKCLLSVMNAFISGPEVTSSKIFLNVWDWGGDRTPILFVLFLFWRFQAENQNAIQNRAINHYMWRFVGVSVPNTMMVYGILISSFSVVSEPTLCMSLCGCFCTHVFVFSLNVHQESWTLTSVCIHGHRQDTTTCLCSLEATVPFYCALSGCCHSATFLNKYIYIYIKMMHINTYLLLHVWSKNVLKISFSASYCTHGALENHGWR